MRASWAALLMAPTSVFLSMRIAHAERRQPLLEPLDERLRDRLLDQQPAARAADLALVEEDAVDDTLDGLVERGVIEHDVGGLATQLQGQRLVGTGDGAADLLAHGGGAREGDLVHVRMRDEREADLAGPGDDVDDPRRQVRLAADVREQQRRQGCRGRRLEHHRVARRERRRDLPGEHQQREVPGDDLRRHAQGLRVAVGERVLQLVRPARVVPEVGRRERHVHVPRFLDGLAAVERLEHRELAAPLLEDARDAVQVLGTLPAGHRAPGRR